MSRANLYAGPAPLAAADTWRPVVEAASFQCQCTGGCGKTHAKDPDHRCPKKHKPDCLLVASAKQPTDRPHLDMAAEQVAYCPPCFDGHLRNWRREQKKIESPREELFGADGEIPAEVAAPEPAPTFELVTIPHGHGGTFEADFRYVVEEAMRLNDSAGSGRIKFDAGAKLALWSLLALGWTPPGVDGDDEAARLRNALGRMRQEMDENRAYSAREHNDAQKAWSSRSGMAIMLNNSAHSLRELAKIAAAEGRPEPTLPVTKVAASLEKALARDRR